MHLQKSFLAHLKPVNFSVFVSFTLSVYEITVFALCYQLLGSLKPLEEVCQFDNKYGPEGIPSFGACFFRSRVLNDNASVTLRT